MATKTVAALAAIALLCFVAPSFADTVVLKNKKELKGLVVERHEDRIVLSTSEGETPILLRGIKDIRYDDLAESFYEMGRSYEAQGKLGEALSFYEKAVETNPNFSEAQKAVAGIRSRFMASQSRGPVNELEKQQMLQDSWNSTTSVGKPEDANKSDERALKEQAGLSLEKKGDWVTVQFVESKKSGMEAGLRKNDRLVALDGASLRYLDDVVVAKKMSQPRFSTYTLDYERDIYLHKNTEGPKNQGLQLKLEYQGIVVKSVKPESTAEKSGLREDDLVVSVNGASTRYMPLKKVSGLVENSKEERVLLTVRRSVMLSRG